MTGRSVIFINRRRSNMNKKKHIIFPVITITAWLGFYLLGIPSHYFTDWNIAEKFLLSLVTSFAVVPFISVVTLVMVDGNYKTDSLWLALYASLPILILDLAVEIIKGGINGNFFVTYWPQTLGYLYVWIVIPFTGLTLHKLKQIILMKGGNYE